MCTLVDTNDVLDTKRKASEDAASSRSKKARTESPGSVKDEEVMPPPFVLHLVSEYGFTLLLREGEIPRYSHS
jgi:hypothetical protein